MTNKLLISLAIILLTGLMTHQVLAQESPQCDQVYTVQAGDWLSKIAEKYYGDPLAFDRIVAANNTQSSDDYPDIANPDLIEPGLLLCLPGVDVLAQLSEMAQAAPPAATRMACAEPAGIMKQEQEYLAALPTAATYQITGDRLEMRTAEGAIVATFERRNP